MKLKYIIYVLYLIPETTKEINLHKHEINKDLQNKSISNESGKIVIEEPQKNNILADLAILILSAIVSFIFIIYLCFFLTKKNTDKKIIFFIISVYCVYLFFIFFFACKNLSFFKNSNKSQNKKEEIEFSEEELEKDQNLKRIIEFCKKQTRPTENILKYIQKKENLNLDQIFDKKKTNCFLIILPGYNLNVFDRVFNIHRVITPQSFNKKVKPHLCFTDIAYDDITTTIVALFLEKFFFNYKKKFQLVVKQIKKDFPNKTIITGKELLEYYSKIFILSNYLGVAIYRITNKQKIMFSTHFFYFLNDFLWSFNQCLRKDITYYLKYKIDEDLVLHFKKKEIKSLLLENEEFSRVTEETMQNLLNKAEKESFSVVCGDKISFFQGIDVIIRSTGDNPEHLVKKKLQRQKFLKAIENIKDKKSINLIELIKNSSLKEDEMKFKNIDNHIFDEKKEITQFDTQFDKKHQRVKKYEIKDHTVFYS